MCSARCMVRWCGAGPLAGAKGHQIEVDVHSEEDPMDGAADSIVDRFL